MRARMAGRSAFLLFASMLVAGCSAIPEYSSETRVRVADVVEGVKCELKRIVDQFRGPPLNLSNSAVGFTLTLRIETEVGATANVDWVIPYHLTDTFTFGGAAGLTNTSAREGSFKFLFTAGELRNANCPKYPAADQTAFGSFGIVDWVEKTAHAVKTTRSSPPAGLDYTLKFGVVANASGKPGFKIINTTGTAGLGGKRTDTHTLAVAFLKAPGGMKILDTGTLDRLNQQLDYLRLRDALRP